MGREVNLFNRQNGKVKDMPIEQLPSAVLGISSRKITSCEEIAQSMILAGIDVTIFSNVSVIKGSKENGCTIVGKSSDIPNLWRNVSDQYADICAHVYIPGVFSGCILDYLANTKCPG